MKNRISFLSSYSFNKSDLNFFKLMEVLYDSLQVWRKTDEYFFWLILC